MVRYYIRGFIAYLCSKTVGNVGEYG